jgi:hypothetical protein
MKSIKQTKVSISTVGIHWEATPNINLNNNNERKDCKIGTMCVCVCVCTNVREEGEWKRLKWGNMVDEPHVPIWNTTNIPLEIALL